MSRTLVLSFFLVAARIQATRTLEGRGGTMQDVEMITAVGNSVKEQHSSDARVRDAIDEVRSNAVQLIREIGDAAKSGSEWEFCGFAKLCKGATPECCKTWSGFLHEYSYECKAKHSGCLLSMGAPLDR
ncbi:unnamed protein product [Symbiodinium sp. CCMP2592]|nr:unnamed protein product [Symbiodinium sp. CCMP2592]